jgi:hypothetical protein
MEEVRSVSEIDNKLTELKVTQIQTHTVVERLSDEMQKYMEVDEARYQDLNSSRLEMAKLLAEVASTLRNVKVEHDKVMNESIPRIGERVAKVESDQKTHGWFIRGLMALTIIASLGGLIGGVNSCQSNPVLAETSSIESSDLED